MRAMQPADLLSTKEAAEILKVERSTLTRWVQIGKIAPAHRLPGLTGAALFLRSDVERLAAERMGVES